MAPGNIKNPSAPADDYLTSMKATTDQLAGEAISCCAGMTIFHRLPGTELGWWPLQPMFADFRLRQAFSTHK
jgi:hypothetical protein